MTLTKHSLKKLSESMMIWFTAEQECEILERFGHEPLPYGWSAQDISEQIHHIIRDYPDRAKLLPELKQQQVHVDYSV